MSTSPTTSNLLIFLYVLSQAMEPPMTNPTTETFTFQSPPLPLSQPYLFPPAALQLPLPWSPPCTCHSAVNVPWAACPQLSCQWLSLACANSLISMTRPKTSPTSSSHHPTGTLTLITPYSSLRTPQSCSPPASALACLKCLLPSDKLLCFRINSRITSWWKSSLKPPGSHPVWVTCTLIYNPKTEWSQNLNGTFHFFIYFTA